MTRKVIDGRFDEIVAFAEVERFLDTPVKRYSSGMYVRLAFAVAAHLEPEILVVDEVLAVGDAAFQKKCLGKLKDVASAGRTVLFVSHNMAAITRLCGRVILLNGGTLAEDGSPDQVAKSYLRSGLGTTAARIWENGNFPGNEVARLHAVRVLKRDGSVTEAVDIRQAIGMEMEYDVIGEGHVLYPNFHVFNDEGVRVFIAIDQDLDWRGRPRPKGRFISTAWIPGNFLAEGTHVVGAALTTFTPMTVHFEEQEAVAFQVVDTMTGDSARGDYAGRLPGVVRPLLEWRTQTECNIDTGN